MRCFLEKFTQLVWTSGRDDRDKSQLWLLFSKFLSDVTHSAMHFCHPKLINVWNMHRALSCSPTINSWMPWTSSSSLFSYKAIGHREGGCRGCVSRNASVPLDLNLSLVHRLPTRQLAAPKHGGKWADQVNILIPYSPLLETSCF